MKILSVYGGDVEVVRGSPLRIKSIQRFISYDKNINLYTATRNKKNIYGEGHLPLKKNIWSELPLLVRYVNKNHIEVVICHGMLTYPAIIFFRLFTNAKVVLEKHGFYEIEQREFGNFSYFRYIKSKIVFWGAYKACHLITTCSDTATKVVNKYNKNTLTIWGGVDLKYFNPNIEPKNYIKRNNEIVIGYAGNTRSYQGLPFLLDTFKKFNFKDKGYILAILSSDDIDKIKIHDGVQLIKKIPHDNVAHFLAECDILVIPRTVSVINDLSFPSKLIEFMAMGKPVVGSRTSDVYRIINHGVNGLLFEPEKSEELVNCLIDLQCKNKRDRLGQEAYDTVQRMYTWDVQVRLLIDNLKKINT